MIAHSRGLLAQRQCRHIITHFRQMSASNGANQLGGDFCIGLTHLQPNLMSSTRSFSGILQNQNRFPNACNAIQGRNYADLPSKPDVERFVYRTIAKSIDFVKYVRNSDAYRDLREGSYNLYLWSKQVFRKYVIENPKVKSCLQEFQRKIEAARQQRPKER